MYNRGMKSNYVYDEDLVSTVLDAQPLATGEEAERIGDLLMCYMAASGHCDWMAKRPADAEIYHNQLEGWLVLKSAANCQC